jgi:Fe-S cluster assembly protein SufD
MRTNIHHVAQGTSSRQEQRNMVGGRSTASFRGRIRVEQSAQQTDSKQLSRTVLLSDYARIWATPSLEIVADDVQCTHGATVSDLSEEELFYLRTRGLDRATARNMLMYAFVDEIGRGVDGSIMGGFDDENGLRRRVIRRLENVVRKGEKKLVGGEFQSV